MTDFIDQAQQLAESYTQLCLERQLASRQSAPAPVWAAARDCDDCGMAIPAACLRVVPGTRLCVHCQEREERHGG